MTDPRNDLVEDLLQERFQGPVADDGFSMRVMEHLPHRSRFAGWPVALGSSGGNVGMRLLSVDRAPANKLARLAVMDGSPPLRSP